MDSLFKKVINEQNDLLSIFRNLKGLSKLGVPESWGLSKRLISMKKVIKAITLFLREYDSFEPSQAKEFYTNALNFKETLAKDEEIIVETLESWGYDFVYSDTGNDLEKIQGLKNPTIEDCLREKNLLWVHRDNLKKIREFLYGHPVIKNGRENVEERIKDLEKIISKNDSYIDKFLYLEGEGKVPKMEMFFSSQVKLMEDSEFFEGVYRRALGVLGYEFLYHGKSIEKILKKETQK